MLGDREIKFLTWAGLAIQAIAFGLGFTALGWRWPIASATIAVAAGIAGVIVYDGVKFEGVKFGVLLASFAMLAAGIFHAASSMPAAAWAARISFGVEFLLLVVVALFFVLFKMDRLW